MPQKPHMKEAAADVSDDAHLYSNMGSVQHNDTADDDAAEGSPYQNVGYPEQQVAMTSSVV